MINFSLLNVQFRVNLIWAIFYVFVFLAYNAQAQRKYGNEWINYGQSYYKIKVVQNGIYRVSYNDLQNGGVNVSSVDPTHLQLFFRGVEVPAYKSSGSKKSFGTQDYFEFYGQGNDGALDSMLYLKPADDINKSYSMYTDTAAYFLTIGPGISTERYSISQKVYGNQPQPYFNGEEDMYLRNTYY